MIFVDGKKVSELDEEKLKILKERFPRFFDAKNPKPIEIQYTKEELFTLWRGSWKTRHLTRVDKAPAPMGIKCIVNGIDENTGLTSQIVLSSAPPRFKTNGEIRWDKNAKINISHGMTLQPKRDLEKLYFLYFYSGQFRNGHIESRRARFVFVAPEVAAASRIKGTQLRNRLENEILLGGKSYALIEKALKAFNLDVDGNEDVDRVLLFDFLYNNTGFVETYDTITDDVIGSDFSEVLSTIRGAIAAGKLISDEEGWKTVGKTGPGRAFAPVAVSESENELAKLLQREKTLYDKVKRSLEKE